MKMAILATRETVLSSFTPSRGARRGRRSRLKSQINSNKNLIPKPLFRIGISVLNRRHRRYFPLLFFFLCPILNRPSLLAFKSQLSFSSWVVVNKFETIEILWNVNFLRRVEKAKNIRQIWFEYQTDFKWSLFLALSSAETKIWGD